MEKGRILVVEDEIIIANDIKNVLTQQGYDVLDLAHSGEDAVRKALELKPDLILMDIMLKGNLDGIEASARINEKENIPIVYLTALSDDATLKRAKITEPFGYIVKPFDAKELHSVIEIGLYKRRMEREKNILAEKVIKLTKKIPLNDNEKKVLHGMLEKPLYNDIELSKKLKIKRSTVTAIKNKLKRENYYSELRIPNLSILGCELLTFIHAKLNSSAHMPVETAAMMNELTNAGDQVYLAATDNDLAGFSISWNLTGFKKGVSRIFSEYEKFGLFNDAKFFYFPFEMAKLEKLFDYSSFVGKLLDIKEAASTGQAAGAKRHLTKKEKIIFYSLVKFNQLNDTELAKKTGLPRPSISQTRRKLLRSGLLKIVNVPNLLQLRCELMVFNQINLDSGMSSGEREKAMEHFKSIPANFFVVSEDTTICTIGAYNDYTDYELEKNEEAKFFRENNIVIKNNSTGILTIPQIKLNKLDFSPILKSILDVNVSY